MCLKLNKKKLDQTKSPHHVCDIATGAKPKPLPNVLYTYKRKYAVKCDNTFTI